MRVISLVAVFLLTACNGDGDSRPGGSYTPSLIAGTSAKVICSDQAVALNSIVRLESLRYAGWWNVIFDGHSYTVAAHCLQQQ